MPEQALNIPRPVNDPEHLDPVFYRSIEDENLFKTGYPENTQASEVRVIYLGSPSYFGLRRQKRTRFVRRHEKPVAEFRVCLCCVVIRLVSKVLLSLRTDGVSAFSQWVPVRLSLSSSSRWRSCQ